MTSRRSSHHASAWFVPLVVTALYVIVPLRAQSGAKNGEWPHWGADGGTSHYSSLDQINKENVKSLRVAWRWKSENFGARPDYDWKGAPLMIGGVLYMTAGSSRSVVAIDAATGETLWMHRYEEGNRAKGGSGGTSAGRGLSYWTDGRGNARLFYTTLGYQLIALDPKTGQRIPSFGKDGVVDLYKGMGEDQGLKPKDGDIVLNSPPGIVGDVVVVGTYIQPAGGGMTKQAIGGYPRGFDARTGKHLWTFRTIPRPGEVGNETWERESWAYTGHTGAWAAMSVDQELGYVYLGTDAPTNDIYGGHRLGDNVFANTIICLDGKTGKRVWHYQTIHHDLWDYDIPAAANLIDVTVGGNKIKALAQVTKTGFVFVLDRVTGRPIWPIEERPVPQSDVPGEKTSPTQPFPTKPAPVAKQGVTVDDLIDFTPALKAEALEITKKHRLGPLYTPASLSQPTLELPGQNGGASWQGAAIDPETGVLYVGTANAVRVLTISKDPKRTQMDYVGGARHTAATFPQGLPIIKPLWGQITAVDLNTGDTLWTIANGDTPDAVKNHPALKGVTLPRTGTADASGLLVTKTLLFSGTAGLHGSLPPGQGRSELLAIDKKTGDVILEYKLPDGLRPTGVPMTYMVGGKQYIVVPCGAAPPATTYRLPGELVALTLSD